MCQPNKDYSENHCDPQVYCENKCSSISEKKEDIIIFIKKDRKDILETNSN